VSATAVSVFVTGRITRPVRALAAAADISAGCYDVDLPPPLLGAEFATLASAFGAMATRPHDSRSPAAGCWPTWRTRCATPIATLDGYLEGLEDGAATWDADTTAQELVDAATAAVAERSALRAVAAHRRPGRAARAHRGP